MKHYSITIAGIGVVGSAIQAYCTRQGIDAKIYDPPKNYSDPSVFKNSDVVFIAVPTPYSEIGFDLRHIDAIMPLLAPRTIVVIKSTVLPGTTDAYQKKFSQLRMMFSPEFLTQKTARTDFLKPTRQIVGYTKQSKPYAERILGLLPRARYRVTMPAAEAEMVKYMNNVFYAMKVTYANLVYDICDALGIDYERVVEGAVSNEPMMGKNHWDVFFDKYRGYGGKCLPKDVSSLIQLGKSSKTDMRLLELIQELNSKRLLKK